MKVLITGANGMVAKAAIDYCRSIGDEVVALTRQELDISDRIEVRRVFEREKFEAVVNCAAYTDVDGAETNAKSSLDANDFGVGNLALFSKKINCAFVTISTDYVFDGSNPDFYTQRDTPNPISFYGKSKFAGELSAQRIYARSIVVRSGWIYGAGGTNFLSVMPGLLAGGKTIKAIADSFGTPTFAGDLARRLRELAHLDLPGIYHVTNAGSGTSYAGFARKICEIKGYDQSLPESVSVNDLKSPAPRPVNSKLACLFSEKFGLAPLPHWECALAKFLE